MEPTVHITQTETADHKPPLLCFTYLGNQEKASKSSMKAKGQCGHFLPCSETSKLVMEMVVPSQRFIVLQAEQQSLLDSVIKHWH